MVIGNGNNLYSFQKAIELVLILQMYWEMFSSCRKALSDNKNCKSRFFELSDNSIKTAHKKGENYLIMSISQLKYHTMKKYRLKSRIFFTIGLR